MKSKEKEYIKNYNKEYYAKNKAQILAKMQAVETCELCGRTVSHDKMKRHQKTAYCMRHRNKQPDNVDNVENAVNDI